MKKRLSIPLVVCAAGLLCALLAEPPPMRPAVRKAPPQTPIPDSYARGVSVRQFDADGHLAERTDARTLRRYRHGARTELEQPRRWGYGADGPWQAAARSGLFREREDLLSLRGDVEVHYPGAALHFATQALEIDLARQIARSQAPVRAWRERHETLAESLVLELLHRRASLSGKVRTRYVPEF